MATEQQLIEKIFYETFLEEDNKKDPVAVLGEAYFEEQKKEVSDLSAIRFAQGEVYFHHKDYEAAVFKWEHIQNELQPWAQKNIGDAYFELGWLSTAESVYKSIETDNLTLSTEIALQLFSLYLEQEKTDLASEVIKETVVLNPDYPNVTKIARVYFEEQGDKLSLVELAKNEAVRLESTEWFDYLQQYIDKGFTKEMDPVQFDYVILLLARMDRRRFEEMVSSLWSVYMGTELHTAWVTTINRVLSEVEEENVKSLGKIAEWYEKSYFVFINGNYLIKEIAPLIPSILTNWLKVSDNESALSSAAAVVSWNEMFPGTLETSIIREAEHRLLELENRKGGLDGALALAKQVLQWADKNGMQTSKILSWFIEELTKKEPYRLAVVGTYESGKESVVNSIIGAHVLNKEQFAPVILEHGEEEVYEITETEKRKVEEMEEASAQMRKCIFHMKLQNQFLQDHKLSFINAPPLEEHEEQMPYVRAADGILFVLNAYSPLTAKEKEYLYRIQRELPGVPVHFLINKMDSVYHEHEIVQLIDVPTEKIRQLVPEANVFAFSPHYNRSEQLKDFNEFLTENFKHKKRSSEQTAKILYFVREMIAYLFKQRVDKEEELVEAIKWEEEMLSKLSGAINQMEDITAQKITTMTRTYQDIKDEIRAELTLTLPKLLRECAEIIKEDSNFGKIHIELNKEMNRRVVEYLQDRAMPLMYGMMEQWIKNCAEELKAEQFSLDEMCESFNALYGEEKLELQCDFHVLEYWQRDAERITSGVYWEPIDIIPRYNPAQWILKGAGKIAGVLSQKNALLYNKYKDFVRTADYKEAVQHITSEFLKEFELFERNLSRDVKLFFKNPLSVLREAVEEAETNIEKNNAMLEKIRENPEQYQDPLTLFELKLRQYEWLNENEQRVLA